MINQPTHPLTRCDIWILPLELPTASCDPSGDQHTLEIPSPSIEPANISLCRWKTMRRLTEMETTTNLFIEAYPVGSWDADGRECGESAIGPIWRPADGRNRMETRRTVEQQLSQSIPYLEVAIFTTASDKIRYRTPRNNQDNAVVSFPLQSLLVHRVIYCVKVFVLSRGPSLLLSLTLLLAEKDWIVIILPEE